MAAIAEGQDEELATDVPTGSRSPPPPTPRNARRFQAVALGAVAAACVPYLWVLWDLWTGTVDPLRINESKTAPGSVIYDVQAQALLHGHFSLPSGSIGIEAFIHDGRTYTYFGIFPSLIRMPILLFTHSLDGHLTTLSILASWVVTALFSALLLWRVRVVVRGDAVLGWAEAVSYGLLIFSILAGSVLVYLASTPNAYSEDEAWGVALACGSLFALLGVVERPSWGRVATAGLLVLITSLNRGTEGYACILGTLLLAAWFALGRAGPERKRWAIPVLIVGLGATAVGSAIDLAKFDVLFGFPVSEQLLYKIYGFSHVNGGHHFSTHFLPVTLQAYLSPGNLRITPLFPYLSLPELPTHLIAHTRLFNVGNTSSVPASMPLFFGAGLWGVITTIGRHRPMVVRGLRILLLAAAAAAAAMLVYGTVYERFLGDFMPLLVLASAIGLVDIWHRMDGQQRSARILVPAAVSLLALFGFVANMGIAIAPQLNWTQTQADHFVQAEQAASDVTGHPLSRDALRGNTFPSKAPMGQLFIKDHCDELFIAYEASPDGYSAPWLPVERSPHTPICDSLIATATNVSLGTSIVSPKSNQTVSGSDVVLSASTSGVGKISSVVFLLNRISSVTLVVLGTGRHTNSGWRYVWDSRSSPNGTYTLRSVAKNAAGYAATSSGVTIVVHNPAKGT